ncbi:MAG: hypothetical protein ACRCZI_07360 [Cetobacterium sp.]
MKKSKSKVVPKSKVAAKKKAVPKRNYKTVTVQDVFDSAAKYGDDKVLSWSPDEYNDNHENGRQYDCTWIPFDFVFANGDKTVFKLTFEKVMAISKAKLPKMAANAKALQLSFSPISNEEIMQYGLKPKEKSSPEKQAIEDEKIAKLASEVEKNTNDFIKALEIINKSFVAICDEIKSLTGLGFSIKKNSAFKDAKYIPVSSLCQTHMKDPENRDTLIKLERPIYRIKLKFDVKTELIGIDTWVNKEKTFSPNVYDIRKAKRVVHPDGKVDTVPAPVATVKIDGKRKPLDKDTAGEFITHHSIHYGDIKFREIIVSTQGFSIDNYFEVLKVLRNVNATTEIDNSVDVYQDVIGSDDEDDVEITSIETAHKFEKMDISIKNKDVESDLEDSVDENSDLDD